LHFSADDAIPTEAIADLEELESAVAHIYRSWKARHPQGWFTELDVSPNGCGISLYSSDFFRNEPTGVWVWPDWRDANRQFSFPDYTKATWLSDDHLLLEHRIVDEVTPRNEVVFHFDRRVIDVQRPDVILAAPAATGGARPQAVDHSHRWYAIDANHDLISGELNIANSDEPIRVIDHAVDTVALLHNATIVAVTKFDRTVVTYSTNSYSRLDFVANAHGMSFVTDVGFMARRDGESVFVEAKADGKLNAHRLHWAGGVGNERPFAISPDGNWTLTWRDTWYGGLKVRIQPVRGQAESKPKAPAIPDFPRGHLKGWLSLG
jgi:hypothetical protein